MLSGRLGGGIYRREFRPVKREKGDDQSRWVWRTDLMSRRMDRGSGCHVGLLE